MEVSGALYLVALSPPPTTPTPPLPYPTSSTSIESSAWKLLRSVASAPVLNILLSAVDMMTSLAYGNPEK